MLDKDGEYVAPTEEQIKLLSEQVANSYSVDQLRQHVVDQFSQIFYEEDPELFWSYWAEHNKKE